MAYGKDELFATHDANRGSIARYAKTLGVVVVVVLIVAAAIFYFTLPGIGDEVKAPRGLEDAVREHFASKEKRETTDEMKVFYCKDYYTAKVKLAPRLVRPNPPPEKTTDNYDVAATEGPPGQWTITARPDFEIDGSKRPCWFSGEKNSTVSGIISTRSISAGRMVTGNSGAGKKYYALVVDISRSDLHLFYKDEDGAQVRNFGQLKRSLLGRNEKLLFAMNAGIYEDENGPRPLGLHVEDGRMIQKLNLAGPGSATETGNFYMLPNGVFQIRNGEAAVVDSTELAETTEWKGFQLATQSGPLLLYKGRIHPNFNEDSNNLYVRNGVGVIDSTKIVFIISEDPINFYDFARVFKDDFECQSALYLDGAISKMYVPEINQNSLDKMVFAGILGVTAKEN